ncbi:MAG: VanZ family protein [Selenomonadaceae bacterium]|nr:VanZ family protein [Selenomonadaceae bacterium]
MTRFFPLTLIFLGAAVAITAFIWFHSLQTSGTSAQYSGFFVTLLRPLFAHLPGHLSWGEMDHIVRKTAHLTEFTGLGFFLRLFFAGISRKNSRATGATLGLGLMVALTDEFLQRFSAGRSSELSDVALDFTGVALGSFLAWLAVRLVGKKTIRG